MDLTGIHHLTAVSADIRGNYRFYTGTLGMRLVKRSVNQDDVSAYHLFYADAVGSPGHRPDLLRLEDAARAARHAQRRAHPPARERADALEWWAERLRGAGRRGRRDRRARRAADARLRGSRRASGWRCSTTAARGDRSVPWDRSPVPAEHQIRGLGPIVMSVPQPWRRPTRVLTRVMNLRPVRAVPAPATTPRTRCTSTRWARAARTRSCTSPCSPTCAPARLGAGGVHHVAFRTPNEAEYHAWSERLDAQRRSRTAARWTGTTSGASTSASRTAILFEIATDGPGFAVDEDPATLGEHVALPPFLEPRREAILAGLEPIV